MSTIIDGSLGITFPAGSNAQAAPAKVLQVVQATYSTPTSNASNSYAATGLSASITPLFSNSKILVIFNIPSNIARSANGGIQGLFQLLRSGSAVYTNTQGIGGQAAVGNGGSTNFTSVVTGVYLDSPATTSSTTYSVQQAIAFVESGYVIYSQYAAQPSTITLMEIAA